jgi:hypothetical protein
LKASRNVTFALGDIRRRKVDRLREQPVSLSVQVEEPRVVAYRDRGAVVMAGHDQHPRTPLTPALLDSLVDPPALRNPPFAPLDLERHGARPAAV